MRIGSQGVVLGFYCSHAYPHNTKHAKALLPRGLKGGDLMVFFVLKCLGAKVKVLPILEESNYSWRYHYEDGPDQKKQRVGKQLYEHIIGDGAACAEDNLAIHFEDWDAYDVRNVTWISERKHAKRALAYLGYGNQPFIDTVYSYAAVIAVIPPFGQRKIAGK
ncbi:uncharacterized protein BDV17DRAFT_286197 [Aspergillus undulatus]|uniref:uncharacterized protein n=1 Tax=Aspergillus undulatus TaxID=1810928 RepID=UPI003CCDF06A